MTSSVSCEDNVTNIRLIELLSCHGTFVWESFLLTTHWKHCDAGALLETREE